MALGAVFIAASAQAGTITVYAAGPRNLDHALASAFEKATGNRVKLWASSTGKVLARLQAEHAKPHADVVILADWSAGLALQSQGIVAPYRPQRVLSKLRPPLKLQSRFLPMGADIVAIVVNTQRLPKGQNVKDWSDLTNAAYRGQITMPSPLLSGTASDFVLGFLQQSGESGWAFFAKLKANGTIWPGPNAAALAPVKFGSRSVLMAGVGHTSLKAKKQGNSLDLILPRSGTLLIPRPIIILKSSKHMAIAKRFVNFVLSRSGQQLVSKALLIPAFNDVRPNSIWPNLQHARFWKVDWARMANDRATTLKRFNATVIH
jgi:iron(III) transport system substrate-binding protein